MSWVSENKDWFKPYVRQMADCMGLKDWEVEVSGDAPEELEGMPGTDAATFLPSSYKSLTLYMPDRDVDNEMLRRTVAHELVHALLRDWMEAAGALEHHVNPTVYDIYSFRLSHEMEQAVEAIAVAWSKSLPMPDRNAVAIEDDGTVWSKIGA